MVQTAAWKGRLLSDALRKYDRAAEDDCPIDEEAADFARAFSLEMEPAPERKWPLGWVIAFALAVSLGLWGLLAAIFYLV